MSQQDRVALVDARLYLPSCWTDDKRRCKKAGVPLEDQVYKTKPELALEMIKNLPGQVAYDWIGGDSLYGNSTALRKGLQRLDKLFVLDVGEDLKVYLQDPEPYIPASKSGRGRKKSSYVSDNKSLKVKDLLTQVSG